MSNTTTNISVSKFSIDPLTGEQTSVNVSVSSDDTELLRLLSLAGFSNPVVPTPQVIEFQPDEVEIADSEEFVPEQADYDYGNNPTSRKGYELELDPYEYTGTAREPVRYTPARMADNPLESKSFIQYLDKVLTEKSKK